MDNRKNTAFTVELLGLFILLTAVITIVTGVFVMTRAHSLQARQLTEAVIIAENAAESASAAADNDALAEKLAAMDNTLGHRIEERRDGASDSSEVMLYASITGDGTSEQKRIYTVRVTRTYPEGTASENTGKGVYAEDKIEVFEEKAGEPIYTLVSGTFFGAENYGERGGRP